MEAKNFNKAALGFALILALVGAKAVGLIP